MRLTFHYDFFLCCLRLFRITKSRIMYPIIQWITASNDRMVTVMTTSLFAFFLLLLASCSGEPPTAPLPPPPQVEVITVTTQTIQDEPEFIGQTEAFRPVEIRSAGEWHY
jgi:membrane fusion protein (multidrug efflux system)